MRPKPKKKGHIHQACGTYIRKGSQVFYDTYPNAKYYGTPRHLKTITDIPWAGETMESRKLWEPTVELRIPDGCEYVDPKPEKNHFCSVFVFHKESKTVFNDDTICYVKEPGLLMQWLAGLKDGQFVFHPELKGCGLRPEREAPGKFRQWVITMCDDWDFDNMCTGHQGNCIGGAKEGVRALVAKTENFFKKLADQRTMTEPKDIKPQNSA